MFLLFFFISVKEAKAEWKKLRDNHRDSLKRMKTTRSGQAATNIFNTWRYAEVMEFLLPYMKNRSRSTNLSSTNTQSSETREVQDDENSEISVFSSTNDTINDTEASVTRDRTVTRKRKADTDLIEFLTEMEQNHQKRQEHRDLRREIINAQKEKDAIDLFLESMTITIKTMPTWMQNRIKKKIFAIVSDAEEELENYSISVTPESVNNTLPAVAGSSSANYGYSTSGTFEPSPLPNYNTL